MIEAYPLYWPEGRPRTLRFSRENARFNMSFARARDEVVRQIEMMCGRHSWMQKETGLVISTNIPLRRDGLPLASARAPEDTGVAVYFTYKKRQMCFACDRWQKVEDNMQAVAKTIDALRGVARWGTGDMMEAAFRGFAALPAPTAAGARTWRQVLGVGPLEGVLSVVEQAYRSKRAAAHPDRGGTSAEFDAVQKAWEQAQRELQA